MPCFNASIMVNKHLIAISSIYMQSNIAIYREAIYNGAALQGYSSNW